MSTSPNVPSAGPVRLSRPPAVAVIQTCSELLLVDIHRYRLSVRADRLNSWGCKPVRRRCPPTGTARRLATIQPFRATVVRLTQTVPRGATQPLAFLGKEILAAVLGDY